MSVLNAYLDTMFTPYPQSPRMLEAKAELAAMMEDAYQGLVAKGISHNEAVGKVITDFGNLDELAPVLGITAEISLQGEQSAMNTPQSAAPASTPGAPAQPPVTLPDAQGYADAQYRTRFRLAAAVAMFVVAPIPIILLPTTAQAGLLPIAEGAATMIGLLLLFAIVAGGVVTIIGISREFTPYARLRDGKFSRNPVVTTWADDLAQKHERRRISALQISVICWVLSPAPLLLLSLIPNDAQLQGFWSVTGVACTLIMVAIGLLVLLPATWAHTVFETLAKGGSHSGDGEDEARSLISVIAAFYWPLTAAAFLAWSFIGNAWGQSWLIWPIAGVLFAAIAGGITAIESYRKRS